MPGTSRGGMDTALLLYGATNTDFDRFKDMLLAAAHFSTLAISETYDPALTAGIIKYESSACLSMKLLETAGCKSDAVTTYETGPITDPFIILASVEQN